MEHRWKMREAILQVIGGLSDDLRVLGAEHFDCDQFVRQLADDASTTSSPFLRGRAIWCASQFARDCAPENSTHFLRAAIGSLQKYVIVLLSKSFNSLSLSLSLSVSMRTQLIDQSLCGWTLCLYECAVARQNYFLSRLEPAEPLRVSVPS
jgi:hypothetical protein